jgi:hypothetical protein
MKPVRRSPSTPMPRLERLYMARAERRFLRRKMPLGRPLPQLKRSPLIPARVARLDRRRCIDDTVSRPVTSPLESTGFRS